MSRTHHIDLVENTMRPSIDFHGGDLHYHSCPECYEHAPCRMGCRIESDLSEERPTAYHVACDGCATTAQRVRRVVWQSENLEMAIDRLARAGMWPWSPGEGPRWCCGQCGGTKRVSRSASQPGSRAGWRPCRACDVDWASLSPGSGGDFIDPLSVEDLVSVASLGTAALERCLRSGDGHAYEAALVGGFSGARIAFRVMTRAEIAKKLWDNCRWMSDGDDGPVSVYAIDVMLGNPADGLDFCVAADRCPITTDRAEAAWPFVREMSRLGLHPISLDARLFVLAVEAL